jgi:hypothetical protein
MLHQIHKYISDSCVLPIMFFQTNEYNTVDNNRTWDTHDWLQKHFWKMNRYGAGFLI